MFWLGAMVLAAGVVVLVMTQIRGTDSATFGPEQGFHPTLPAHSTVLKNADGKTVRTYSQLDPEVRSTIRTFLSTAVARKHLDKSWAVIAPSVKVGYTYKQWKNADALPVIPYPIADLEKVQYYLDYASTKEILLEVGLASRPELKIRPASFLLGLSPVGQSAHKRWLVDYWMPRWTPPLPVN
jgi:hypothetical protein